MWNEISAVLSVVLIAVLGFVWFYHHLNKPDPKPKPPLKVKRPDGSDGLTVWISYAIDCSLAWMVDRRS